MVSRVLVHTPDMTEVLQNHMQYIFQLASAVFVADDPIPQTFSIGVDCKIAIRVFSVTCTKPAGLLNFEAIFASTFVDATPNTKCNTELSLQFIFYLICNI